MIKTITISLLLLFTINAKNVWYVDEDTTGTNTGRIWYVDKDATGANTGRSWTDAWTSLDSSSWMGTQGVNWAILQAGDTVYISGGTDSKVYLPNNAYGSGITRDYTTGVCDGVSFSGVGVVVAPAWHSGHNGTVYFSARSSTISSIFRFSSVSNVKIDGGVDKRIKIIDERPVKETIRRLPGGMINIGNGDTGDCDSRNTFENIHFISAGIVDIFNQQSSKFTMKDCIIEILPNHYSTSLDPIGFNTGRGGNTLDGNVWILRNDWKTISGTANGAVTFTSTSLTDTRLNMIPNYYSESHCIVGADNQMMWVDSNSATTFYGTATSGSAWMELNYTYLGNIPANGSSWGTDDPHKDVIQFSNFGFGETYGGYYAIEWLDTHIKNNLIIDQATEGTAWNGLIYSSGSYCNQTFYVYNNVLISNERNSTITGVYIGQPREHPDFPEFNAYTQKLFLLNNTIIVKGNGNIGEVLSAWNHDTLMVKNNLFICDTTTNRFMNLNGADDWYDTLVFFFDYNLYAELGGMSGTFASDSALSNTFEQWKARGKDPNSTGINSASITFSNKFDTLITGYYTETGRDMGTDLSAEFPFLQYDAAGNLRTGTWDIGALEYPTIQHNRWVGLGHSVMRRYFDYEGEISADSSAPSMREEVYRQFNSQYSWGADSIFADWRYFPETPYGTDWINWLYCFRGEIDDTSDNWLTSLINEFDVIVVKGGIQTCDMTDLYGSSADTSGAGVTKKSVYNYKWIWREMLEYMEAQPDKFFVLMPGSGSGDYKALGSQVGVVAKEFAAWCEDTLQAGLDPIYGTFPENVYVFNQFKYLTDSEGWLKDEYESRTPDEDDHPNATAMRYVIPLFVQEIGDAVLAWEGSQIPDPPPAIVDTIPTFSFTPVTNAALNSYNIRTAIFSGADSVFTVWTETADSFKVGALSNYDIIEVEAEAGDTVFITNIASGLYETQTLSYIRAGGNTQSFSVTTELEPVVSSGNGILKGSNGVILRDSTGKVIKTQ